jgi:hypothetical protein
MCRSLSPASLDAYNRRGTAYSITGLSSLGGASNLFQWDVSSASSILTNSGGISFSFDNGEGLNIYSNLGGFNVINQLTTTFSGLDGVITSSSLNPVAAPEPVPGPLPLLGAAAAFGWSRRMRRRLKVGTEAN